MEWLKTLIGDEDLYSKIAPKLDGKVLLNDGTSIPKSKFNETLQAKKAYEAKIVEYEKQLATTGELLKGNEGLKTQYETQVAELQKALSLKDMEIANNRKLQEAEKALIAKGAKSTKLMGLLLKSLDLESMKLENGELNGFDVDGIVKEFPEVFSEQRIEGQNPQQGKQVSAYTLLEQQLQEAQKNLDLVSVVDLMEKMAQTKKE